MSGLHQGAAQIVILLQATSSWSDLEFWGVAGQWAGAFATLAVALVVVWLQRTIEKRRRPTLDVVYSPGDPVDNTYLLENESNQNVLESEPEQAIFEYLWLRVNVSNPSKNTAENVQLRFIRFEELTISNRQGAPRLNRPSWWFKVSNLNLHSIDVPAGFPQAFDIAYIKNRIAESEDLSFYLMIVPQDMKPWLQQQVSIENSSENKLEIGSEYTILFALVGSNTDANFYHMNMRVKPPSLSAHELARRQGRAYLVDRLDIKGPFKRSSPLPVSRQKIPSWMFWRR